MKRSEINALISKSIAFTKTHGFFLPPFAFWTPEEWKKKGSKADEIRDCMLGWDIIEKCQICPMHFHWNKAEDIINRGGGNLAVQLYHATPSDRLSNKPVTVSIDGTCHTLKPGGIVRLRPGESICLPSRLYHKFWGEKGKALLGEVSKVNDDRRDNRFYEPLGRFPEIDEDQPARYLLFSEYPLIESQT